MIFLAVVVFSGLILVGMGFCRVGWLGVHCFGWCFPADSRFLCCGACYWGPVLFNGSAVAAGGLVELMSERGGGGGVKRFDIFSRQMRLIFSSCS